MYGRNVLLLFREDLYRTIMEGNQKTREEKLTDAATIIREDIVHHPSQKFEHKFDANTIEKSVPNLEGGRYQAQKYAE